LLKQALLGWYTLVVAAWLWALLALAGLDPEEQRSTSASPFIRRAVGNHGQCCWSSCHLTNNWLKWGQSPANVCHQLQQKGWKEVRDEMLGHKYVHLL